MELALYEVIVSKMNDLGVISGVNIDEYVELSNTLLENLEKVNSIDIEKLKRLKIIDNYRIILSQINKYKSNEEYIRKQNEYLKNKQKELSYTLQYQRHRKYKLLPKKKSIYSNK